MEKSLISQNSIASIYKVNDGEKTFIEKMSRDYFALESEKYMLEYLKEHGLSVPDVISYEGSSLFTSFIIDNTPLSPALESQIAAELAALHENSSDAYGFYRDTTIGPYRQRNDRTSSWIEFYKKNRLNDFAVKAYNEGKLPKQSLKRLEKLLVKLESYLFEPEKPSLIHGDIWSGNVLIEEGKPFFIDPAIYYAHNEAELAFIRMFNTFSSRFFAKYNEIRKIEEGFWEERVYLYQLFPYLVHIRSFGNSYLRGFDNIIDRFL